MVEMHRKCVPAACADETNLGACDVDEPLDVGFVLVMSRHCGMERPLLLRLMTRGGRDLGKL